MYAALGDRLVIPALSAEFSTLPADDLHVFIFICICNLYKTVYLSAHSNALLLLFLFLRNISNHVRGSEFFI
jgi:hypothetical protein